MIVKKLRKQKNWTQDQLAIMCGLSIRTIQRIESGQSASLESLKCLASVFEIEINKLTEEITVIDKNTESWKDLPWWYRFNMFGIKTRRLAKQIELTNLFVGFIMWFLHPLSIAVPVLFLAAYVTTCLIRYGDEKNIW